MIYRGMSVVCQINCVGGITWPKRMLKVFWGAVKPVTPTRVIHFLYARALAWTKEAEKSVHLEMRNLKLTELQRLKNRGKKG